jgi:hypothetical protein
MTLRISRWAVAAIPVPLWLLLTYVLFAPLLHDLSGPLPGGADSILYSWYFKEIQTSLWNGHSPFFSTAMNYPTGLNLMWNTAIILPAFLMTPITATLGAGVSVALLMIAAPLAAAATAYRVLYRMTGNLVAGAVGGTLYGFGPFYAGQHGHVHLTLGAVFLPLILSLGYRMVATDDLTWRQLGWRLGVVVGIAMLVSEEIVAIAGVVALLSLGTLALRYRDQARARRAKIARTAGWAAGVALCVCGPFLVYQFLGPLVVRKGFHSSLALDLLSPVRPGQSMYFSTAADAAANRRFPSDGVEATGYLGILLIVATLLACVVLYRRQQRTLVFWLVSTGAIAFGLSLGTSVRVNGVQTYIPTPWFFLSRVPVVETIVPARFSVVTLLIVATILAFGIAALPRVARGQVAPDRTVRRLQSVAAVLVVLSLAACWPARGSRDRLDIATPAFFTTSAVHQISSDAVVLALPQAQSPDGAAAVMKWQIDADMRFDILGGYSYFSRDGLPHYEGDMPAYAQLLQQIGVTGVDPTAAQARSARQSVTSSAGDYVVVTDQVAHPAALVKALPGIAGCTPQRISDVYLCKIVR